MKLGNYKDNDVELCRTTNSRVSTHTAEALLEQHIPFTKNSKKIPFFKRETYQGADTLWVIRSLFLCSLLRNIAPREGTET